AASCRSLCQPARRLHGPGRRLHPFPFPWQAGTRAGTAAVAARTGPTTPLRSVQYQRTGRLARGSRPGRAATGRLRSTVPPAGPHPRGRAAAHDAGRSPGPAAAVPRPPDAGGAEAAAGTAGQGLRYRAPPAPLARRFQRSEHGPVGFSLQPGLVAPQEDDHQDDHRDADDRQREIHPTGELQQLFPEEKGGHAVDRRPDDTARRIEDQEPAPVHSVDTRQEGGEDAQNRYESPKEHHLRAVLIEEVLTEAQPILLETDVAAISFDQPIATGATDPVADVVAHDGARR